MNIYKLFLMLALLNKVRPRRDVTIEKGYCPIILCLDLYYNSIGNNTNMIKYLSMATFSF